jgi:hypothetical protein
MLTGFFADMLDRSAVRKTTPQWDTEALTTIGIAVLAASAQAEAAQKLASQLIGDFANLVQFFLMLAAVLWCLAIIGGKVVTTDANAILGVVGSAREKRMYAYSQALRFSAKAGLLILIAFVPSKLAAIAVELSPLPSKICGYIYNGEHQPVDGARVWLISHSGDDTSDGRIA